MNFVNVKVLTIPEGSVTKISRKSDGALLWKKQTRLLPSQYQQVEYIGMTGTQGLLYSQSFSDVDELIFTISFSEFVTSYIAGTYFTANTLSYLNCRVSGSGKRIDCYMGGDKFCSTPTLTVDTVYSISVRSDRQALLLTLTQTKDDEVIYTSTLALTAWSGYSIYNFGVGCNGYLCTKNGQGSFANAQCLRGKMYAYQHKSNGETVRNFIPCYRISDGVIGMYDTVSETFFTNAGTGSFTKGSDVK